MSDIYKKLESITNIVIIIVAVLFGTVLISRYFGPAPSAQVPSDNRIAPNTKINLGQVDWSSHDKNLVMAFSTKCRYCLDSIQFYRHLARQGAERKDVRLIVTSPEAREEVSSFFAKLEIDVDEVVQAPLSDISVAGTPTLVLVDRNGMAQNSWVGKLPPDQESEVVSALF